MSNAIWMPGNSHREVEYVMEEGAVVHYSCCLADGVSVLYGIVKCEGLGMNETELGKDAITEDR